MSWNCRCYIWLSIASIHKQDTSISASISLHMSNIHVSIIHTQQWGAHLAMTHRTGQTAAAIAFHWIMSVLLLDSSNSSQDSWGWLLLPMPSKTLKMMRERHRRIYSVRWMVKLILEGIKWVEGVLCLGCTFEVKHSPSSALSILKTSARRHWWHTAANHCTIPHFCNNEISWTSLSCLSCRTSRKEKNAGIKTGALLWGEAFSRWATGSIPAIIKKINYCF